MLRNDLIDLNLSDFFKIEFIKLNSKLHAILKRIHHIQTCMLNETCTMFLNALQSNALKLISKAFVLYIMYVVLNISSYTLTTLKYLKFLSSRRCSILQHKQCTSARLAACFIDLESRFQYIFLLQFFNTLLKS